MNSGSSLASRTRRNTRNSSQVARDTRKRKGRTTSSSDCNGKDLKRSRIQNQNRMEIDVIARSLNKLATECSLEKLSLEANECLDSPSRELKEDGDRKKTLRNYGNNKINDCLKDNNGNLLNVFLPIRNGKSPLPELLWANPDSVWEVMQSRETHYQRDPLYLKKHPSLQVRMRTVLLDWLIEVCEVYRLHRETFHLAVDFVDRYLSVQRDIPKQRLQLIGVTSLFVAAKIEEIYPPKIKEFAYVTDGACTVDEITKQELIILQVLDWKLSPITANSWLTTYLQINHRKTQRSNRSNDQKTFELPNYPPLQLSKVSQLIDLCLLDMSSLNFSYSVIASSCLHHILSHIDITDITGYSWNDLSRCIEWLTPFAKTIKQNTLNKVRQFEKIPADDAHNIQIHSYGLNLLDKVHEIQHKTAKTGIITRTSPVQCGGILTPPNSTKKDY